MDKGYIKIHRKIMEWYGFSNSKRVHLWVTILCLANHSDRTVLYDGNPILVRKGQFITSRRTLSQVTGISGSYVENLLNEFELQRQIQQQNCTTSRLITITNYNVHQILQPRRGPRRGQQKDHGEDTTNTLNKLNKYNIYISDKTKHLDYVYLTDSHFKTLQEKLGVQKLNSMIERVNNYIGQIGEDASWKKYKSHYHVILNWWRRDNPTKPDESRRKA